MAPDRKKTPNVLDDLLGGAAPAPEQHTSTPVHQYTSTPVKRQASKPARQLTGKQAGRQASKATSQQGDRPGKATFYLSQTTLDSLEEAWITLRKMARAEDRAAVSKSAIVEQAILLALEDLKTLASKIAP